MLIGRIAGANAVLAENQPEYLQLPVKVEQITIAGASNIAMTSAWHPTPHELQALIDGAAIYLTVITRNHPPVLLSVGEPLREEAFP